MAFDAHKNFAYSTVLTAPSTATAGTSLVVQSGNGTLFPTPPFNACVWPAGAQPLTTNSEIVRVTNISTDTFTIARGATSGAGLNGEPNNQNRSIIVGDQIAETVTAKTITDIESGGNLGSTAFVAGTPVQIVSAVFSAVATGTTVLPSDDTIPQNTEGDQYMTLAITPKSTTNRLFIEAKSQLANSSVASDMTSALFQDATANAIAAGHMVYSAASYETTTMIGHDMAAGTTSSTTFKVRSGSASAGTTTFNGVAGTRRYGGISFSYIKITEYKA